MSDLTGQRFGNYRLIRLLGQGGFADTYLGEQVYIGTDAAIKIVQTQLAQDDQGAFFNEARTIAKLRHPKIIRLLDFGVESSRNIPYLVMDYAPDGTLRQRHSRGEVLPVFHVVSYVKQVAAALQYAHEQKVIHRDIKPENMLVGAGSEILLGDFGIAVVESSRVQTQSTIAGTMNYMAPEQIRGKPIPASDQYALAVVAYEWLSGGPPFTGSYAEMAIQHEHNTPLSLRERVATIPVEVEQVVLAALAKDPQRRFKDVQTFAYALEQASNMGSSPSRNPSLADLQIDIPTARGAYVPPLQGYSGSSPGYAGQTIPSAYGPQPVRGPRPPSSDSSGSIPVPPPYSPDPGNPYTPPPLAHESFEPRPTPQLTPPLNTPPHSPVQEPYAPPQGSSAALPPPPGQAQSTSSTSSGSSQRWRPSSVRLMILLIVLVLLLLGSSGFIYYYTTVFRPSQLHTQATATAQAQANAAHAQATANVQATATALQNIYTQSTSRTPTISDPLSGGDNFGWDNGSYTSGSSCLFQGGAYHVHTVAGFLLTCAANSTNFSNLALQVQMTIISGHSGGLIFRCDSPQSNFYAFRISTDGTYILKTDSLDKTNHWQELTLTSGMSSAIHMGNNAPNQIAVVAQGNTFYLYVNKQYVASASDSTYKSGKIGVFADSDTESAEIVFSNLQVWRL